METGGWFLKNLYVELPYNLATALLGIYPKELKQGFKQILPTFILANVQEPKSDYQQMNG